MKIVSEIDGLCFQLGTSPYVTRINEVKGVQVAVAWLLSRTIVGKPQAAQVGRDRSVGIAP